MRPLNEIWYPLPDGSTECMAVIQAIPGAQFVLEVVAIGTVVATGITYRRRERNPDLDVGREVANASVQALAFATLLQLLLLIVG